MKTRAELITDFTTLSRDSSAANTALGRSLIDMYTNKILTMKDWTWNRSSYTQHAMNNEWSYPKAYNAGKIIGIKTQVEENVYWPTEVMNRADWEQLTGNRTAIESNITTRFFIDTNSIEIYPVPNRSAEEVDFYITQYFTKTISSRSAADYSTGTISRSASSRTVYGTGTVFNSTMIGKWIRVSDEDEWYEIDSIVNATKLVTSRESRSAELDDQAYTISEMIPLPHGAEDIPLWWALESYFSTKENIAQAKMWREMRMEALNELVRTDAKSTGNVLERDDYTVGLDVNRFPSDISG